MNFYFFAYASFGFLIRNGDPQARRLQEDSMRYRREAEVSGRQYFKCLFSKNALGTTLNPAQPFSLSTICSPNVHVILI